VTILRQLATAVESRVRAGSEIRGLNDPSVPLTAASLVDWLGGQPNDAGIRVTEQTAYGMSAVHRSVSLVSHACAGVPLIAYSKANKLQPISAPVLDQPCPGMTPFEFWELVYAWLLTWGNFYAFRNMDNRGVVQSLIPIPPSRIKVGQSKRIASSTNPFGKIFSVSADDGNGEQPYTPDDIFHVPALGYDGITGVSPLRLGALGIGTALAAERYTARQFAQGVLVAGILQTEQRITTEQADALAERWRAKVSGLARAHDIVALGNGAKFQPISMPNTDAQMIETRKFQVDEIARWFGIPPFMLGSVEKTTSWGTGIEQQKISFVDFTLDGWLKRVAARVTMDVVPSNAEARHDVRPLTRGDSGTRTAYYTAMRNLGAMNADEIRDAEGMAPLPDGQGQTYITPLNMAPTTPAPTAPADGSTDDSGD
jgi:HK97 family phage portal protein